ncbi:hypothetical protein [Rhizobium sp. WYCCWR 11152]
MAVTAISDILVTQRCRDPSGNSRRTWAAERAVDQDDEHELSDSNRAATLFPVRVLLLANEAPQRGKTFTFSDYAELVEKLT